MYVILLSYETDDLSFKIFVLCFRRTTEIYIYIYNFLKTFQNEIQKPLKP